MPLLLPSLRYMLFRFLLIKSFRFWNKRCRLSLWHHPPLLPLPCLVPSLPLPQVWITSKLSSLVGPPLPGLRLLPLGFLLCLIGRTILTQLSLIFRPIGGSLCKLGVLRFETYEDRRDFIAICKDTEDLLDFSHKGVTNKLYIKASVPKGVANDTDILRSAVFKCHELLKPSVNTKEQLLTCYKTRTLTLFDTPIAFYIDAENFRLKARKGGEFCIDREVIARLASENGFIFDCNQLVQFLSKKFSGRTIVDK